MSRIVAAAPAVPAHRYTQAEITRVLEPLLTHDPARAALLRRFHASSGVQTRHLVMELERYAMLDSFHEANDLFISAGTELAEQATRRALDAAGIRPDEVDFVLFTSVTGVAAPSIDAQLAARVGMRRDVKRLPSFGLGCVAGAAGLARVHDYLVGHPHDVAVLVSVELCSLTVQRDDDSVANIVASGLFGDGAAAVVVVGDAVARERGLLGPDVVATRSSLYPQTEDVIGWDIGGTGFRIVLSAGVPDVIGRHFAADVHSVLRDNGLTVDDVATWLAHPGGPKVLQAFAASLGVADAVFDPSWRALAAEGNQSSAAVLGILADALERPAPGDIGLLFALGPGVTAELVLLRWPDALASDRQERSSPVRTAA
ncbi:type III polyketide synthase [Humibacter ginsenosidimutans]|uniref:Type III polyketide synthase n=1 Tax=Humibacter ginsenosidimutans TaxID=2599293 RepID=A0A5B8M5T7_9MICO|nr:3-oxoacyl-[acyl-carrier-protein] synthase III C-terminal domain-containing protein [Humibacter ginsenosidimutans]QDZ15581.1 type III polyketide synthase [Humibacter ginsenosidimutans]